MNKKIFITYGDAAYSQSLKRIQHEAEACGEFDEIIVYTDRDLPEEVKSNELFKYKRGGGYWLWKPYICLKTLALCDDTDIIVYSDCGNEIYRHKQWKTFWKWMEKHSAVFFYYGALMVERSRKSLLEKYLPIIPHLKEMYQVQGSIFIFSKKALPVIRQWLDDMLKNSEYVLDVKDEERNKEFRQFIENRHDQAVLSCAVYKYWKTLDVYVTRQRSERFHRGGQAVFNARISNDRMRNEMVHEKLYSLFVRMTLVDPFRKVKMMTCKQSIKKNDIYLS